MVQACLIPYGSGMPQETVSNCEVGQSLYDRIMAQKKKKPSSDDRTILQNRKARHNYAIDEEYEAGIVLTGSEVKSLRAGKGGINDAYGVITKEGNAELHQLYIAEYKEAGTRNHETHRTRRLLLKQNEIKRLVGKTEQKGFTLVPLRLFFTKKGLVKVIIGVAKGKSDIDKRQSIKDRDWKRKQARMRQEG